MLSAQDRLTFYKHPNISQYFFEFLRDPYDISAKASKIENVLGIWNWERKSLEVYPKQQAPRKEKVRRIEKLWRNLFLWSLCNAWIFSEDLFLDSWTIDSSAAKYSKAPELKMKSKYNQAGNASTSTCWGSPKCLVCGIDNKRTIGWSSTKFLPMLLKGCTKCQPFPNDRACRRFLEHLNATKHYLYKY